MLKDNILLKDINFVKELDEQAAETICGGLTEDCISFNPDDLKIELVNGRVKIVEGCCHWMMDFDTKLDEAITSLEIIKKYGFTKMCFVGRPDPSMTYFL